MSSVSPSLPPPAAAPSPAAPSVVASSPSDCPELPVVPAVDGELELPVAEPALDAPALPAAPAVPEAPDEPALPAAPEAPGEPFSASAMPGLFATAAPMPSATANAPTLPMKRAYVCGVVANEGVLPRIHWREMLPACLDGMGMPVFACALWVVCALTTLPCVRWFMYHLVHDY